jgi:hypothetical protein
MRGRLVVAAIALSLGIASASSSACKGSGATDEGSDAAASPQATAVPAPLAIGSASPQAAVPPAVLDGGAPFPTIRAGMPLEGETAGRDAPGYTLSAVLRLSELTGPPRAAEVNAAGVEAARKRTELRMAVEMTAARMRTVLQGHGWLVPPDTELRSRGDRLGHVVVWPGGALYRPLAPGSLRALFAERRFDVAPIAPAQVVALEETGKRIGIKTRRVEVTTRAAKVTFDLGRLEGLGDGGVLLCRALLDLASGPPTTPACLQDELPLRAELHWSSHGAITFEVTGVLRRPELVAASFTMPPAGAVIGDPVPPKLGMQGLLSNTELAALRTAPVDVPPGPMPAGEGLLVANGTDQVRMLFVDGVPVAWVSPGGKDGLYGLQRGRYIAQWRTFFGDAIDPPVTQIVPGAATIGPPDAGTATR